MKLTLCRFVVLAIFGLAGLAGLGLAQFTEDQLGVPTDFEKSFASKPQTDFYKLLNSTAPLSEADKALLDTAAKYYVWRITWLDNVPHSDKLVAIMKDFEQNYTSRVVTNKQASAAKDFFNAKLTESFKAVFDRKFESNRISTINAGQMLPIMAKGKSETFSAFLVELIKDNKKHEAVRLYGVRALAEYFPAKAFGPNDIRKVKDLDPEIDRIKTLTAYIERPSPKGLTDEVFIYLRREAIQALAQAQAPAILVQKGKVEGQTVITLMNVLAKKKMDPEATLAEKCEAALGLCNMKLNDVPDYQPQMGIYAVGVTFNDFVTGYRADYGNFAEKKRPSLLPWKIYAERWKQGLENLTNNTKEVSIFHPTAPTMAKALNDKCNPVLPSIASHKTVDANFPQDFQAWIAKQKPTVTTLFKTSKTPEVNLGY
jgi:hypothetical protein